MQRRFTSGTSPIASPSCALTQLQSKLAFVRDEHPPRDATEDLFRHLVEGGRVHEHGVGDPGQAGRRGMDAATGVHERVEGVRDAATAHLDHRDLGDAVAGVIVAPCGLDVHHRVAEAREGGPGGTGPAAQAPTALVVHVEAVVVAQQCEDGFGRRAGVAFQPEHFPGDVASGGGAPPQHDPGALEERSAALIRAHRRLRTSAWERLSSSTSMLTLRRATSPGTRSWTGA